MRTLPNKIDEKNGLNGSFNSKIKKLPLTGDNVNADLKNTIKICKNFFQEVGKGIEHSSCNSRACK